MLVNDANYFKIKHGVLCDMVFITSKWRSLQLSLRVAQPFMTPSHAFHIFPGVVLFFNANTFSGNFQHKKLKKVNFMMKHSHLDILNGTLDSRS